MNLESLRAEIDALDAEIIERLNRRATVATEIGGIKRAKGEPYYDPSREQRLLARLEELSQGPLGREALRAIYREVISANISLETELTIGFLGPEATYTEQAARANFGSSVRYEALGTIQDVFEAVERSECTYGVIPIENSSEGGVVHALDMMIDSEVKIINEVYLPIEHCLISATPLEAIRKICSKDQALGQCREWLRRHCPTAQLVPVASTAECIDKARDEAGTAVIASALAAEVHQVPVVSRGIQDRADNTTRFLVIGRDLREVSPGVRGKTSLLFTLNDEVGALQGALAAFGTRSLNMCRIESRPSRRKAFDYVFFVDIEGHYNDPNMQDAVADLKRHCPLVKWLGSYPAGERG